MKRKIPDPHQAFMRQVLWLTLAVVLFGLGAAMQLAWRGCEQAAITAVSGSFAAFIAFLRLGLSRP